MDYLPHFLFAFFLLFTVGFFLFLHLKKKAVIKKVRSLSHSEKDALLDTLGKTIGYGYDAAQDLFVARKDAPQKIFGYNTLFDLSAPYFNMIFDYETIYFDYNAKTWLIEMWKGQYGINTGCELGIYCADKVVEKKDYDTTHFHSVEDKDMLYITMYLKQMTSQKPFFLKKIGRQQGRHWWMTMFKLGIFTKPENLYVNTSIHFKDYHMMYRFLNSFEQTLPDIPYRVDNLTVFFTFKNSNRTYSAFKRFQRKSALTLCHFYCLAFHYLTRPFENSGNKVLYLYYYMPFFIRLIFKSKMKTEKKN